MTDETYGYICKISTEEDMQKGIAAMAAKGVPLKNIYIDRYPEDQRAEFDRLVRVMKQESLLYVQSMGQLGWNFREIRDCVKKLTKEIGIDLCVLDLPLLDTRNGKGVMGTYVKDLVLQILTFVVEYEQKWARKRQASGILAARKRGVQFGRPGRSLPDNFKEACGKWASGEITATAAAKECGMPLSTFLYHAKKRRPPAP